MSTPLELCIEVMEAKDPSRRFLSCVAMVGSDPGLTIDGEGAVSWGEEPKGEGKLEIWVSGDQRLILYRQKKGPKVKVRRGGRSLDVPKEKPVVLLDQDDLYLGSRHVRVHIHGAIDESYEGGGYAPHWFQVEEETPSEEMTQPPNAKVISAGALRATAAALALGTAMGASGCHTETKTASAKDMEKSHEMKVASEPDAGTTPPAPRTPRARWVDTEAKDAGLRGPKDHPPTKKKIKPNNPRPPIQIRRHPPKRASPRKNKPKPKGPIKIFPK